MVFVIKVTAIDFLYFSWVFILQYVLVIVLRLVTTIDNIVVREAKVLVEGKDAY